VAVLLFSIGEGKHGRERGQCKCCNRAGGWCGSQTSSGNRGVALREYTYSREQRSHAHHPSEKGGTKWGFSLCFHRLFRDGGHNWAIDL
jgi:hypothetical protein